jgi:hypothetical protein
MVSKFPWSDIDVLVILSAGILTRLRLDQIALLASNTAALITYDL